MKNCLKSVTHVRKNCLKSVSQVRKNCLKSVSQVRKKCLKSVSQVRKICISVSQIHRQKFARVRQLIHSLQILVTTTSAR